MLRSDRWAAGTVTEVRGAVDGRLTGVEAARPRERVYDQPVSVEPSPGDSYQRRSVPGDPISRRWVEQLHPEHPRHEQAVASLHDVLRRAALHELHRRRAQLPALVGPEFDDIAQQCADDAAMNVLARIDHFHGLSRFTTWAYKFAIFEVSSKLARHAWQRQPPNRKELEPAELPDAVTTGPSEQTERREQLLVLRKAIEEDLTPRQREVFVAIALNDEPIDVLALALNTNRNAIYKNLFDARRKLRESLAAAGHPLTDEKARV
jgi:RNA polymerase sigma-70 factor (ECF subfamily)